MELQESRQIDERLRAQREEIAIHMENDLRSHMNSSISAEAQSSVWLHCYENFHDCGFSDVSSQFDDLMHVLEASHLS